jgi:hypothetical protein
MSIFLFAALENPALVLVVAITGDLLIFRLPTGLALPAYTELKIPPP